MRLALIALLLAVGLGVLAYVDNIDEGPEQALLWAVFVAGYGILAAVGLILTTAAFVLVVPVILLVHFGPLWIHKKGDTYVQNVTERFHFTERLRGAAEQGDADAQCQLGYMYVNGEGVLENEAEAVKWFRKAAEQGHSQSQCSLGVMYQYGRGVPQSDIEAYVWFSVSTTNGYEDAEQFWSEVKAELTPEQLGTAEDRATELFEQINAKKAK